MTHYDTTIEDLHQNLAHQELFNRSAFMRDIMRRCSTLPHEIHPTVLYIMHKYCNSRTMLNPRALFSFPHISADPSYCLVRQKSYEGWDATDKYTLSRLGKVLKAIFPELDHAIITKTVEEYTAHRKGTLHFTESTEQLRDIMLWMCEQHDSDTAVKFPRSCMTNPDNVRHTVSHGIHPYQVYAHELGWSMAYVTLDKEDYTKGIMSRAIVNHKEKTFVRTYAASSEYQVDERLALRLEAAGYTRLRGWDGYAIAKIECEDFGFYGEVVMPYVDGSPDYAVDNGEHNKEADMPVLTITNNVNGTYSAAYPTDVTEGYTYRADCCECCGAPTCEDNLHYIDVDERNVCTDCRDEHYVWIDYKDAYYRKEDTVLLSNGEYALDEDAVYVDRWDDYICRDDAVYSEEDDEYIHAHHAVETRDGDWAWEEDCWQDYNGDWHRDNVPCVEDENTGEMYTNEDYDALILEREAQAPHKAIERMFREQMNSRE